MSKTLATQPFALTAANSGALLNIGGFFVRCVSADEDFEISIDGAPPIPLGAGRGVSPLNPDGTPSRFNGLNILRRTGATAATNNLVLVYGNLAYYDDRLTITSASAIRSTSATTLSGATADVMLVADTNTLILAANSARRCARITNNGTADTRVSSAPADLTAGRGEIIRPGEAREFFVTGAIYARSTGTPTLNPSEEVF
jgi:hypothetical protein